MRKRKRRLTLFEQILRGGGLPKWVFVPGVIEGTLSTVTVGKVSRLARLKMWRISPVVSEMVPWQV